MLLGNILGVLRAVAVLVVVAGRHGGDVVHAVDFAEVSERNNIMMVVVMSMTMTALRVTVVMLVSVLMTVWMLMLLLLMIASRCTLW